MLHHRKSNRWVDFDYSGNGWYFVTICTGGRIQSLCSWLKAQIVLNDNGKIVEKQWRWMGEHFKNVCLDEWVVMPNHVHGIVIINHNLQVGTGMLNNVGTGLDLSLQKHNDKNYSLSQIIGAFKTTSSKLIHQNGFAHFCWQRSFHDRIIRSEKELESIRWYIKNNPKNWENDRNNI